MWSSDGVYGPRTQKAIDDFRRTFALPVDGDISSQLSVVLQALKKEAAKPGLKLKKTTTPTTARRRALRNTVTGERTPLSAVISEAE